MTEPLRPVRPSDLADLSRFLVQVHRAPNDAVLFRPSMLDWKYLSPGPDWMGARGYLLEKHGRIVACGGISPVLFRSPKGDTVSSLTLMDWAADRSAPGAGFGVLRGVMDMADTIFVIGGLQATRNLLPAAGFRQLGCAQTYARWVRPWKEFRLRPKTPQSALRLLHGLTHPPLARSLVPGDWDHVPVARFDDALQRSLNQHLQSLTTCRRTPEVLNYMLACPAGRMTGYLLRKDGRLRGYFLLCEVAWEARIVDIFIDSDKTEDWRSVYAVACNVSITYPDVCRIRALASAPLLSQALLQNGFWLHSTEAIMFHDPSKRLAALGPMSIQLFEGDAAYS